jgi:hypothetical protein
MYRSGTPGTVTLHLTGVTSPIDGTYVETFGIPDITKDITTATTNGDTLPTAVPYEWREFTFAAPVDLTPGITYIIWLQGTTADNAYVRYDNANSSEDTLYIYSSNAGVDWSHVTSYSTLFDLIGTTIDEIEHGACDLNGLTVANPNGQFNLTRYFYNNCGVGVDIKECGIYTPGLNMGGIMSDMATALIFSVDLYCIARDVIVPTITLGDGETLQITYVPAITV